MFSLIKHSTIYTLVFCLITSLSPSVHAQDNEDDLNFQTRAVDAIENLDEDNSVAALRRTTDNQTQLSSAEHSQELAGQYAEQVALTYALVEHLDKDCKADPIYKAMVPSFDMLGNTASFQHTLFEATKLKKDVAQAAAINAELGGCKNYQIDDVRRAIALINAQLATVDDHIDNFESSKEMYLAAAEQTRAEDEKRNQEIKDSKKSQSTGIIMVIAGIAMVALGLATLNFILVAAGTALIIAGIMMQMNAEKNKNKKTRQYVMQCNEHCYVDASKNKYEDQKNSCNGTIDKELAVPTLSGEGLVIPSGSSSARLPSGSASNPNSGTNNNGNSNSNSGQDDNSRPISAPASLNLGPPSTYIFKLIVTQAQAQNLDAGSTTNLTPEEINAENGRRLGQNERGEFEANSTANATSDIQNNSSESFINTIEPLLRERNNVLMATPKSRYDYLMHVAEQMEEASARAQLVKDDLLARKKALMELERRLLAQQQSLAGADGGDNNNCTNPFEDPNRAKLGVTLGDKDLNGVGCVKRGANDALVGDPNCDCKKNDTCASVKDSKIKVEKGGPFGNETNGLLAQNQRIIRDLTNKAFRGEGTSSSAKALRAKLSANTGKIRKAINRAIQKRKEAELAQLQKANKNELKNLGLTEQEVDKASASLQRSSSSAFANPLQNGGFNNSSRNGLPDQEQTAEQEGSGQTITTVGDVSRGGSGSGSKGGSDVDADLEDLNEPYNFDVSDGALALPGGKVSTAIPPLSQSELAELDKELQKSKYDANASDSLFGRVTKAYIRAAYPVLLKRKPASKPKSYLQESNSR